MKKQRKLDDIVNKKVYTVSRIDKRTKEVVTTRVSSAKKARELFQAAKASGEVATTDAPDAKDKSKLESLSLFALKHEND